MAKRFSSSVRGSYIRIMNNYTFPRRLTMSGANFVKVGERIPSVEMFEGTPANVVNIHELCKDKKVVLFGVPGAFTPSCSNTHLPGFVERFLDFKKKGVDEIICVSVNDVFVMDAWGKDQNAIGKVRMLADPNADFTKAVGMEIDLPKLGGLRSKRYSMVIEKGIVTFLNIEPDGTGLTCSLAPRLPI